MRKVLALFFLIIISKSSHSLEKCSFELKPKNIKMTFTFHTGDFRKEQRGQFNKIEVIGILYGNSVRDVFKNLTFYFPYKELNSFNSKRDRIIYENLINLGNNQQDRVIVKIKKLRKKELDAEITINNITRMIKFQLDSQDISLQSIGNLDVKDFSLSSTRDKAQVVTKSKLWDDIYIDLQAKFTKTCKVDL